MTPSTGELTRRLDRVIDGGLSVSALSELRPLLADVGILLFAFDAAGTCTLCEGPVVLRVLGLEPEEATGRSLASFAGSFPEGVDLIGRALRGEHVTLRGLVGVDQLIYDLQVRPLRNEEGAITAAIGIAFQTDDVEDGTFGQRQREHRAVLAALPDHVLRVRADGMAMTLKPARTQTAVYPAPLWVPAHLSTILPADLVEDVLAAVGDAEPVGEEALLHYSLWVGDDEARMQARVLREGKGEGLLLLRDVTEQRRQELEFQQASKLEALGRLAAGVAHEINTPTQFISHNVEFMSKAFGSMHQLLLAYREALHGSALPWEERSARLDAAERDHDVDFLLDEVPQAVNETLEGTRRVTKIVQAMKVFSHPSARELGHVDLNEVIRNAVVVSASEHKNVAHVVLELQDLPPVLCVVAEITQVLLNLIVNAAQALEPAAVDGARGTIAIRSRVEVPHAVIEVADDGPGISEQDQERIFDAFFTTKEVGTGTGQGLTLVHSIVADKHGGRVGVRSAPGRGATFEIRLPIDGPPAPDEA